MTGPAERARARRRAGWLAVICILLLLPTFWLLTRDARSADVRSTGGRQVSGSPEKPRALAMVPDPVRDVPVSRKKMPASATSEDTCDDPRVLVDRKHGLPANYAPDDLVSLPDLGLPILGQEASLRREAAESLERLVVAAAVEGEELVVASAYRSYADQQASYNRLVSIYGKNANKTSAPPGHSQHQLGTAVDFTNADVGYEVGRNFGRTSASRWLLDNAPDHGFALAYPRDQEEKTGFRWEPWHYRYVGVGNARKVVNGGLGLQGLLSREGVLPRC